MVVSRGWRDLRCLELLWIIFKGATAVGGFDAKGFISSGEDRPDFLSDGRDFVLVSGSKWFSKKRSNRL